MKVLFLLTCLLLFSQSSFSQFTLSGDTCTNPYVSLNYSFRNYHIGGGPRSFNIDITRNGTLVYQEYRSREWYRINSIVFINDSVGFFEKVFRGVFKTTDSAKTWKPFGYNNEFDAVYDSLDIAHFINDSLGYLAYRINSGRDTAHKIIETDTVALYRTTEANDEFECIATAVYDSTLKVVSVTDTIHNARYFCSQLKQLKFNWKRDGKEAQINLDFVTTGNSLIVNIKEPTSKPLTLEVFPNPANSVITINTGTTQLKNATIYVFNLSGQLVYNSRVTSTNFDINISELEKGLYLLKYENDSEYQMKKIIKQ